MWKHNTDIVKYAIESDPPGRTINLVYIRRFGGNHYETFVWRPKLRDNTRQEIDESLRRGVTDSLGFRRVAVFDDLEQAKGAGLALYYMQDTEE